MSDAARYAAFYDGKTTVDLGRLYGPRTCGCVALIHWERRSCLTYESMAKIGPLTGWHDCPHCLGSGVDQRIVESLAATIQSLALVGGAACR